MGFKNLLNYLERYNFISLVIVIILAFILINPLFFKNKLSHEAPQGFLAGDAFWHHTYVEHFLEGKTYNLEPYLTAGFENNPPAEPPLSFYMVAHTALLFDIPSHSAINLTFFILLALCIGIVYYFSDLIHPLLPYFSLPATLTQFRFPFTALVSWGYWKFASSAILLLFFIVVFLQSKRTIKNAFLLGIFYSGIIIAHPSLAPYVAIFVLASYIVDLITKPDIRFSLNYFFSHAVIGLFGITISIDYLMNFAASRVGNSSFIEEFVDKGYHLFAATPQIEHLGLVFWFALGGFALYFLFFQGKKDVTRKAMWIFGLIFLILLGPLIGFDRAYQFRLLWPIYISIATGFVFLVLVYFIKHKFTKFALSLLIFIGILVYLFMPLYENSPKADQTISIIADDYWKAMIIAKKIPDADRVLILDPLTQSAVALGTRKYSRFLYMEDAINNINITNFLRQLSHSAKKNRVGFFTLAPNTDDHASLTSKMEFCKFDLVVINKNLPDQYLINWMNYQINLLADLNLTTISNAPGATVLKNEKPCN